MVASSGDAGTLVSLTGGAFHLAENDGLLTAFKADGTVDYVEDPSDNRITAGYSGESLTSLTHSSGQGIQIAWNAAGRISGVTDGAGHETTYSYDASNEHLMTVERFDGQLTRYSYNVGGVPTTEHALLSITTPDGVQRILDYGDRGRLLRSSLNGGAHEVHYAYGSAGEFEATSSIGGTTTYMLDHRGAVAKVEDPIGRLAHLTYDDRFNLTRVVDAIGQSYSYSYDSAGNLLQTTDPLGQSSYYEFDGLSGRTTSVTDPLGNVTLYEYNTDGDLSSAIHADGSVETWAHDPVGNILSTQDRRGEVIRYTHDAGGRVLSKTYADDSEILFSYTASGYLASATDDTGQTTLTWSADDRLMQIDYPNGRSLSYLYDGFGRRTRMTSDAGLIINYTDDVLGRLRRLADDTDATIVQYLYDTEGRLLRKDNGNDTATTYEYDLAGQLLRLTHLAPDDSVNAQYTYTYDELGRRATAENPEGSWAYTYDAIGQLKNAVFTSNDPNAVPHQDLRYAYDAAGIRLSTEFNGVATNYVTNNLNQYESVGSTTYTYDAAGNRRTSTTDGVITDYTYDQDNRLIQVSSPDDTWTYEYDALVSGALPRMIPDFNSCGIVSMIRTRGVSFSPIRLALPAGRIFIVTRRTIPSAEVTHQGYLRHWLPWKESPSILIGPH